MKKLIVIGIIILLIGMSVPSTGINVEKSIASYDGNTLYVGGSGPGNYTKIQDAIYDSANGDKIFVYGGFYLENIQINKTIELTGEDIDNTIIDGNNIKNTIEITSKNVVLSNFTIQNSGGHNSNCGIEVKENNFTINNCILIRAKNGILIKNVRNTNIKNCYFYSNGRGICIESSFDILINECIFGHNSIGFFLNESENCSVYQSYFHTNGISCLFNDSSNIKILNCNLSDNSVNLGGVFFIDSFDIDISNSIFNHNGASINIFSSEFIEINYCNFNLNTHFAISLRTPSNNIDISNCKINDNYRYGLYVEPDNEFKMTNCNIENNTLYGLFCNYANCYARNNWWGSPFGPSLTELRPSSKISIIPTIPKIFPWKFKKFNQIGADLNFTFVDKNLSIKNIINLPGEDSDEDGLPDWWEEKWGYDTQTWDDHENLDPDEDAINNYEECYTDEYGSNPFYKDIFLEIDWMKPIDTKISNKPSEDLLEKIVKIFKNNDINLHIDVGNLGGGQEIPSCEIFYSFTQVNDIYWEYFLENNINCPRKGIFHYGVICNYCPDSNFPFFGWDQLDSFAISSQLIKEKNPLYNIDRLVAGAIVHHLGHTLGLLADAHGGIDNIQTLHPLSRQWWKYINYQSCMNYFYKYKILSYSDGTHGNGDFDDWDNLDFGFFKNSVF